MTMSDNELSQKEVTPVVKRNNLVIAVVLGLIAAASTLIPVWMASRMGMFG